MLPKKKNKVVILNFLVKNFVLFEVVKLYTDSDSA